MIAIFRLSGATQRDPTIEEHRRAASAASVKPPTDAPMPPQPPKLTPMPPPR